jgi:hypothetical protein
MQDILTQIKQRLNQNYDYTTDPYYQSQVQLAEQQGQQASQQSMEELNARGILNSTITADRVAQAMQNARTERLPGAISQANQMRQSETGNILSMLNAYAGLEGQDYTRWRQADQDALTRENTIYTRQRQVEQDQIAKNKLAIDQAETKLKNAWERVKNVGYVDNTASVVLGLPVNTPTLEAQKIYDTLANQLNIAREDNDAAMERVRVQEESALQRSYISASRGGASGAGNTLTERTRSNYAEVIRGVQEDIADGKSREEIEADIQTLYPDMIAAGVDPAQVLNYLNTAYPAQPSEEELQNAEQERLQARPWWQKAVDILPGEQYR